MGVHINQEKYEAIEMEKIAEEVFEVVAQWVLRGVVDEVAGKLEEKAEKARENETGNSWISPFIVEYQEEVDRIYEKYVVENHMIEGNSTKPILLSILQVFGIGIEEKDIFLFDRMVENRFKHTAKDKQIKYLKLTYSQLITLIEEWALKDSIKQVSLSLHIENTISEYQLLLSQCEFPDLSNPLGEIIKTLKLTQKKITAKPENSKDTALENHLKSIKEIFAFYAKQLKMLGNAPTFDEITDHQNILNISKFTKFCSDFDITNKQNKDHLSVQQVTQAFLNGNECSRSMNLNQFVAALDALAEIYYNEQYDARNNTKLAKGKITVKRAMFYEYLQLGNRTGYMQKAKGFGLPFSKEKAGYRLPDYDLSKNYKFKDTSKQKKKVDDWKKSKIEAKPSSLRSISIPNPARIAAVKNSLLQRKDRVTWDILKGSQQSSLISKDDLALLFTETDLNEIIASNKNHYK